jgi:putative peptidoglycan lipid II flippase
MSRRSILALSQDTAASIRLWSHGSSNRRIFIAAASIGGLTFVVKLGAMAKDVTVAYLFGRGGSLDAFLAAFLVPTVTISVISGSMASAFIPAYVRVEHQQGPDAARDLLRGVVYWCVMLLGGASIVLGLARGPLIHVVSPGFDPERRALAESYLVLLLPCVLLSGIASIWTATLNAKHQYLVGALAPIIVPLLTMLVVLGLGDRIAGAALCYGTVLGYFAQCMWLLIALKRRQLPVGVKVTGFTPEIVDVLRQFVPAAAGTIVMNGSAFVDQAMASFLGAGGISTLSYANKIVTLVSGLISMAIGTAVLPHYSEMVAKQDWRGLRRTLHVYTRLLTLVTIPAVIVLILGGRFIVALLFQRGAFGPGDTAIVTSAQSFYLLQVPFFAVGILLVRLISALQRNSILFWGTLISLLLNAVLDYVFMQYMGVAGIALSTSCVYAVSWLYLRVSVGRILPAPEAQSAV